MVESRPLAETPAPHTWTTQTTRVFVWSVVLFTAAFVLNAYLSFWQDWPGTLPLLTGDGSIDTLVIVQAALYVAAIALAVAIVASAPGRSLRSEIDRSRSSAGSLRCASAFWGNVRRNRAADRNDTEPAVAHSPWRGEWPGADGARGNTSGRMGGTPDGIRVIAWFE
mgnify:CR=1 FL=1